MAWREGNYIYVLLIWYATLYSGILRGEAEIDYVQDVETKKFRKLVIIITQVFSINLKRNKCDKLIRSKNVNAPPPI